MRIIGGEWRGRKIEEPRGRDVTRPTTDRVREACASMVMSAFDFDLDEVRVLDAFGGSGARPHSLERSCFFEIGQVAQGVSAHQAAHCGQRGLRQRPGYRQWAAGQGLL